MWDKKKKKKNKKGKRKKINNDKRVRETNCTSRAMGTILQNFFPRTQPPRPPLIKCKRTRVKKKKIDLCVFFVFNRTFIIKS